MQQAVAEASLMIEQAEHDNRELTLQEIEEVQGGFACGGLCVAGAFAAGALVGGGLTWWALS